MLSPMPALQSAGIPTYFGAWRKTEEIPLPPPAYIVYTLMRTPDDYSDDELKELAVYAYVNLWTLENPAECARAVRAAMRAHGWEMQDERQMYGDGENMYLTAWTWKNWEAA